MSNSINIIGITRTGLPVSTQRANLAAAMLWMINEVDAHNGNEFVLPHAGQRPYALFTASNGAEVCRFEIDEIQAVAAQAADLALANGDEMTEAHVETAMILILG